MLWAVTDVFFDTLWNGVCVSSLVCREKPQRGSLKKLQAHRKQRSTHCENILYQGEVGKIPPHTYITVECLVSVDKGAETEGGRESHVVLQELENKEGDAGWTVLAANEKMTQVDTYL